MIARCPHCGSIWVCWNWINAWGGDFERFCKENPTVPPEELKEEQWGHECWDCDNCHTTENRVTNGIPYWILSKFHKYFGRTK